METETLEAKLRNQLTPIYGLADMILALDTNPDLMPVIIGTAKQIEVNKKKIKQILSAIELKKSNFIGEVKICECEEEYDVNILSLEPPIATCSFCGGIA